MLTENTRDKLAIVSLALSATAITGAVAFWLGGLDENIKDRLTELASETTPPVATEALEPVATEALPLEPVDLEIVDPRVVGDRREFANTVRWGKWSVPAYCPTNHYVCGLAQKAEPGRGSGTDDTAVNGIAFYCCPLPAARAALDRLQGRFVTDGKDAEDAAIKPSL